LSFVEKAFVREIFIVAIQKFQLFVLRHLLRPQVEEKVVVCQCVIVEKVCEQKIIMDKRACDERVWKVLNRHRKVVDV